MGRLVEMSFALKERLESIEGLSDAVIVFRQDDMESLFRNALRGGKGTAAVVRLIRGQNFARRPKLFRGVGTYTVTIFSKPVLRKADAPRLDELVDEVATAVHGWWPESIPSNGGQWCEVTDITFPDDSTFAVARLSIEAPGTST